MKKQHNYIVVRATLQELIDSVDLYKSTIDEFNKRKVEKIKYVLKIKQLPSKMWECKIKISYAH